MRRLLFAALSTLSLSTAAKAAGGEAVFSVEVDNAPDFDGKAAPIQGDCSPRGGKLYVLLKDFDAGWMPMRTTHLKEHMQAEKWPRIAVEWHTDAPFGLTGRWAEETLKVTIWGVKKDVVALMRHVDGKIEAKFSVLLSDFGISKPERMGAVVQDRIRIHAWTPL